MRTATTKTVENSTIVHNDITTQSILMNRFRFQCFTRDQITLKMTSMRMIQKVIRENKR